MDEGSDGTPAAPTVGREPVAVLRVSDSFVTFVQTWTVEGYEAQRGWFEVMHASIHILRTKPGFVSMTLHSSVDATHIAVYAQWASRQTLETAVADPEAMAAHDRMARFGTPTGNLYTVEHVYVTTG